MPPSLVPSLQLLWLPCVSTSTSLYTLLLFPRLPPTPRSFHSWHLLIFQASPLRHPPWAPPLCVSHDQETAHSPKAAVSRLLSASLETELRSKAESISTLPKHHRARVPCVMQKGHRHTHFPTFKTCSLSFEGSEYF